ncbi:MAG: hypothetical protein EOO43_16135, partial [Flavobacterium sp.]
YDVFAVFDGVSSARNSIKGTILCKNFIKKNHENYLKGQARLDLMMRDCNDYLVSLNIPELYTTHCVLFINRESSKEMVLSHLGDSRIYLITKQFIEQLTMDHKHHYGNVITKCLGMNALHTSDFEQKSVSLIDKNILLCTDGFYPFLEDNRLLFFEILNRKNFQSIKQDLTSLIINKNKDDATFLLIR